MKRLTIFIFLIFALAAESTFGANPVMDVNWVTVTDNGSVLVMKLQVKASGASQLLNSSDFYFEYDATSLTYSSFTWASAFDPSGSGSGIYQSGSTIQDFGTASGFDGSPYNELDIELKAVGSTTGVNISSASTYIDVATLTFTISSSAGNTTLNWDPTDWVSNGSGGFTNQDMVENSSGGNHYFDNGTGWNTSTTIDPLPVTLTTFSAIIEQGFTQLNWSTASEINNAYFTIERSQDGVHFEDLLTKEGSGTSFTKNNYTAYDKNPLPGTSYYRLKQTDFNGRSETFYVSAINNAIQGEFSISSVSPTNFTDNATLYYKMPAEGAAQLVVRDLRGRIVKDEQVASLGGDNKYEIDNTSGWMPGVYIATVYYDGRESYIKLIKN